MNKPTPSRPRIAGLDMARGIALLAMIAYHLMFDLAWFRIIDLDVYQTTWVRLARAAIVTAFLFIAGMSLTLAARQPHLPARFWKRLGVIAACAALISLVSYRVFPYSWIYFGVLHCIVISTLLALPFLHSPKAAIRVGSLIIVIGALFHHPFFNPRELSWIGFVTELPRTEDFVPLFPWLGIMLLGVGIQGLFLKQMAASTFQGWKWLRWFGRHSLVVYMLHQPLLIGVIWSAMQLVH